jgi:PAS domain S-box-containing protein
METSRQREPYAGQSLDLAILERIVDVGNRCVRGGDSDEILGSILDAAIFITCADKGNIQLYDPLAHGLVITAQRGFERPFLDFFSLIQPHSATACAAAYEQSERVDIEDVTESSAFAGSPALQEVLLAEGVRAVQSTNLVSSRGRALGVISTHFARPSRLTDHQRRYLDILARQASDYLERTQTEAILDAKRMHLERITENVPSLITQCSRDLRYEFVNKACAEFLGRPREQILGTSIVEVIGEPALETIRPYIDLVLKGQRVEFETDIPYATTGPRHMHVAYVPYIDGNENITGWVGTITDITERRRAEQKLQDAERHKDEFLAMLAHELRNPLAPIAAAAEVLQRKVSEPSLQGTLLALKRQSAQMVRLVDDLMDVSRSNLGKIELRKEPIDLRSLAEQAVSQSRSVIDAMEHEVKIETHPMPVCVNVDPARLMQVLCNLLNNASKFMDRRGLIQLIVERVRDQGIVRVRDQGIGLASEDIPHIFDLFVQLDDPRKRPPGGLGIGLTLAKSVVEQHGGKLEVRSGGRGQGSEFLVRLPILREEAEQPPAPVVAASAFRRCVLIVDDNVDAAESLAQLVEMHGHLVSTAFDGEQGLEVANQVHPEIVFLDIGMPDLDGHALPRRIRSATWGRDLTLVALTGYGREGDIQQARAAGFDHYLLKPLDLQNLARLLAGSTPSDDKLCVEKAPDAAVRP